MSDIQGGPPLNERSRAGVGPDATSENALRKPLQHSSDWVGEQGDDLRPRWRHNATGETSKAAALAITPHAPTLRARVLACIEARPSTPEAVYAQLLAAGVDTVLTSVRPRTTELRRMGLVTDSGLRGLGESGRCKSIIWRATTPDERFRLAALAALAREKGPADE